MDEITARFELLKAELSDLQQGIRAFDQSIFQVKGWAVTVGLASAGLALTSNIPSPAVIGSLSAIAFLVIDAHLKMTQRRLIRRSMHLESMLASHSIYNLMNDASLLQLPRIAGQFNYQAPYRSKLAALWRQLRRPSTFIIYAGLIIVLTWVAQTT